MQMLEAYAIGNQYLGGNDSGRDRVVCTRRDWLLVDSGCLRVNVRMSVNYLGQS